MSIIETTLFILAILAILYWFGAAVTVKFLNRKHESGFSLPWYLHASFIIAVTYSTVVVYHLKH